MTTIDFENPEVRVSPLKTLKATTRLRTCLPVTYASGSQVPTPSWVCFSPSLCSQQSSAWIPSPSQLHISASPQCSTQSQTVLFLEVSETTESTCSVSWRNVTVAGAYDLSGLHWVGGRGGVLQSAVLPQAFSWPHSEPNLLEFSSRTRESQACCLQGSEKGRGQSRAQSGASGKVAVDPPSAATAHVPRMGSPVRVQGWASFPNCVLPGQLLGL